MNTIDNRLFRLYLFWLMTLLERQELIKDRRKQTSWQEFLQTIASWYPLALYKNNGFVSIYPESDKHGLLVDPNEYEIIRQSLPDMAYDPNQDFFIQFASLFLQTPKPHLHHFSGLENALYTNYTSNTSNAYLSFNTTGDCSKVYYSLSTKINSHEVYNSVMTRIHCTAVYQSVCVVKSHEVFYSSHIEDCTDIRNCENMIGCQHCIACNDLTNQLYCINNQVVSHEEYEKYKTYHIDKLKSGNDIIIPSVRNVKHSNEFTLLSSDYQNSFCNYNVHEGRNIVFSGHEDGLLGAYDTVFGSGGKNYAAVCGINWDSENIFCSVGLRKCFDVYYSYYCEYCSFCLGCVGLKNKSYCILNKQYTQDEWYAKVDEIFWNMQKDWTLWSFFPMTLNPFGYDDTLAWIMDAEHVLESDDENIIWDISLGEDEVFSATLIDIWMSDYPKFTNKVIVDSETGKKYKILPQEAAFLQKYRLPLPTRHWLSNLKLNLSAYL